MGFGYEDEFQKETSEGINNINYSKEMSKGW